MTQPAQTTPATILNVPYVIALLSKSSMAPSASGGTQSGDDKERILECQQISKDGKRKAIFLQYKQYAFILLKYNV